MLTITNIHVGHFYYIHSAVSKPENAEYVPNPGHCTMPELNVEIMPAIGLETKMLREYASEQHIQNTNNNNHNNYNSSLHHLYTPIMR